jgi:hypothetical protein
LQGRNKKPSRHNCRRITLAGLSIRSNRTDKKIRRILYIQNRKRLGANSMKKGKFFSSKRKCVIYEGLSSFVITIRTLQLLNFLIFLTMLTEDERNSLAKINKPVAVKLNAVFN